MPPAQRDDEDGLPSEDEEDEKPLLDKQKPKSDAAPPPAGAPAMLSPREKLREKGKRPPLTPRSAARELEQQGVLLRLALGCAHACGTRHCPRGAVAAHADMLRRRGRYKRWLSHFPIPI